MSTERILKYMDDVQNRKIFLFFENMHLTHCKIYDSHQNVTNIFSERLSYDQQPLRYLARYAQHPQTKIMCNNEEDKSIICKALKSAFIIVAYNINLADVELYGPHIKIFGDWAPSQWHYTFPRDIYIHDFGPELEACFTGNSGLDLNVDTTITSISESCDPYYDL